MMVVKTGITGCASPLLVIGEVLHRSFYTGEPIDSGKVHREDALTIAKRLRYRANPLSFRAKRWGDLFKPGGSFERLRSHIQSKHAHLEDQFPIRVPQKSHALEPITWAVPFESNLAATDKAITFIVPWL